MELVEEEGVEAVAVVEEVEEEVVEEEGEEDVSQLISFFLVPYAGVHVLCQL